MPYRIGSGIDFHKLVEGRELWIGGIKIPHHKGALGHSDADVLLHAVCDALLGAACLGDIGEHFPDTNEAYKNIDSKILLQNTFDLIKKEGYTVVNMDSTLCLQSPKIKPYVSLMQKVIANILGISEKDVSIKATTTEQLGFVGREEGLVAYATVLLEKTSIVVRGSKFECWDSKAKASSIVLQLPKPRTSNIKHSTYLCFRCQLLK
jgi:2-C-methyl-D-erythritol 2,4-cyclodiphosphate synthase